MCFVLIPSAPPLSLSKNTYCYLTVNQLIVYVCVYSYASLNLTACKWCSTWVVTIQKEEKNT